MKCFKFGDVQNENTLFLTELFGNTKEKGNSMLTFDEQYAALMNENSALREALATKREEEDGMMGVAVVIVTLFSFGLGIILGINL